MPEGSNTCFFNQESSDLKYIFFLFHGIDNSLKNNQITKALEMLLRQSFLPYWDINLCNNSITLFLNVLKDVSTQSFYFVPSYSAISYLNDFINKDI